MNYLALYRKYRPKVLDEVVGQSEIKKILASSVKNGTITHAYLFSGPRGTGKTTMAKILAKMVNCLNPVDGNACDKCDSCINILNSSDVIEIDAASNNGVDEIRDLREKANLVPATSKYKVYIIDEVHMLTTQAFNALLKTLEEPPKHVIFILATTEYYKIPLTITSRCQKFQFNKITDDEIVERLKYISKLEKIKISDEALFEIAKISDGGMRDSINFLDQLRSFTSNKITIEDVESVCGNVSSTELIELFRAIRDSDFEKVISFFEKMDSSGKNYAKFLEDVINFLNDIVLFNKNVSHKYIKSNIDAVKTVNSLFSVDEIFYFIDNILKLIYNLKGVSRQSVMIIANFVLMMNEVNNKSDLNAVVPANNEIKEEINYDMAFKFTSSEPDDDANLTVNELSTVDNKEDLDNGDVTDLIIENKKIIINNTFAVASKDIKNNLQKYITNFNDYLTDAKYKAIAASLIDTKIEVAGKNYIIFSATNDAVVQKIYSNYRLCYEFICSIFNDSYNFAILTVDEWSKYRDEYVNNFKNGKKYDLLPFDNALLSVISVKNDTSIVDKLFDLVGEDNVEFK